MTGSFDVPEVPEDHVVKKEALKNSEHVENVSKSCTLNLKNPKMFRQNIGAKKTLSDFKIPRVAETKEKSVNDLNNPTLAERVVKNDFLANSINHVENELKSCTLKSPEICRQNIGANKTRADLKAPKVAETKEEPKIMDDEGKNLTVALAEAEEEIKLTSGESFSDLIQHQKKGCNEKTVADLKKKAKMDEVNETKEKLNPLTDDLTNKHFKAGFAATEAVRASLFRRPCEEETKLRSEEIPGASFETSSFETSSFETSSILDQTTGLFISNDLETAADLEKKAETIYSITPLPPWKEEDEDVCLFDLGFRPEGQSSGMPGWKLGFKYPSCREDEDRLDEVMKMRRDQAKIARKLRAEQEATKLRLEQEATKLRLEQEATKPRVEQEEPKRFKFRKAGNSFYHGSSPTPVTVQVANVAKTSRLVRLVPSQISAMLDNLDDLDKSPPSRAAKLQATKRINSTYSKDDEFDQLTGLEQGPKSTLGLKRRNSNEFNHSTRLKRQNAASYSGLDRPSSPVFEPEKGQCPICLDMFNRSFLERHASVCEGTSIDIDSI